MDCDSLIRVVQEAIPDALACNAVTSGLHLVLPVEHSNGDAVEVVVLKDAQKGYLVVDAGLSAMHLAGYGIDLTDNSSSTRLSRVTEYAESKGCVFEDEEVMCYTDERGLYEALFQVAAVAQMVTALPDAIPANRANEFVSELAVFFSRLGAHPSVRYEVDGFTRKKVFGIRLNSQGERLIRTISAKSASGVTAKIERSWYAFNDVARVGRPFIPTIIFDDSDEELRSAWKERHFRMMDQLDIPVYGFIENNDQLLDVASRHRRPLSGN